MKLPIHSSIMFPAEMKSDISGAIESILTIRQLTEKNTMKSTNVKMNSGVRWEKYRKITTLHM